MSESANKLRRQFDRRLVTILLIVFVGNLGGSMVLPIFPLYAQRRFNIEPSLITLLVSSFFVAQFFAGPKLGRLSDLYGRRPVLVISQLGTVVSFIMMGAAGSVWMLLAGRVLDGITGGNIIVAQAYITDITPREKRTESIGLIFAAFGLGFIFGPALGGIMSSLWGEQFPFYVAAALTLAITVLTWYELPETIDDERRHHNRDFTQAKLSLASVRANTPLVLVLVSAFCGQFALGVVQSTLALYGEKVIFAGYAPNVVSLLVGGMLAGIGFAQLFTQLWLIRRLLERFHEPSLVLIGTSIRALGFFTFAFLPFPIMGVMATLAIAMGAGTMMPALQSTATITVPDELRGGVLGWYQSSISLSVIFSTALGGTLFEIQPNLPFIAAGVLLMIVMIPAVMLIRWTQTHRVDELVFVDSGDAQPVGEAA